MSPKETPDMEHTVLIHLILVVEADDDEGAEQVGRSYLRRHNIPVDDIAAVESIQDETGRRCPVGHRRERR